MKSTKRVHQSYFYTKRFLSFLFVIVAVVGLASAVGEGSRRPTVPKEHMLTPFGDVSLNTLTKCDSTTNVVYAGRSMKAFFKGPWADYIGSVKVEGTDVTARIDNHFADGANSKTEVFFSAASNAAGGERKVTAVYLGIPTPITSDDSFRITVFAKPTLSGATVPTFQNYFQTADVTLRGTNLTGANKVTAKAKIDAFNPIIGYAGETVNITNGTSIPAQVVRADNDEAVIRLVFPQRLTKAAVDLLLTGDGSVTCSSFGSGISSGPPPTLTRAATLTATASLGAYVQSIDVINSRLGSVAEFTITLTRPVPRSSASLNVYWKMIPSNIFGHVSGDVAYDGSGTLNRTTIGSGDSIKRIKLSVTGLPPGGSDFGGTAYIETWIGNTNSQEAPYYFKKAFNVSK